MRLVGLHLMTEELVLTFKIKNNMVPDYLSDLFPRSVENPQYNLRQQNDFLTLPRRTSLIERSFVHSAIQQWNIQHSVPWRFQM